jgi:uncharacterized membrane protein YbhN (UPF0104 family)
LPAKLARLVHALARVAGPRLLVSRLSLLALAQRVLALTCIYCAGRSVGLAPTWIATVAASAVGSFASLVALTPGAVGLFELASGLAAKAAGIEPATVVASIVAFRAFYVALSVAAAGVGLLLARSGGQRT